MSSTLTVKIDGVPTSQLDWDKGSPEFRSELLAIDAQRHSGVNTSIVCPCGHDLVIRVRGRNKLPLDKSPVLASWPEDEHENAACLCAAGKKKPPLIDFNNLNPSSAFGGGVESCSEWRLRMASVFHGLEQRAKRMTTRICASGAARPSAATYKCIGGIYDSLAEAAGLCQWSPERSSASNGEPALELMERRSAAWQEVNDAFLNRTVFYRHGYAREDLLAAEGRTASALGERILLIFRANFDQSSSGAWVTPDQDVKLVHSPVVAARLSKASAQRLFRFVRQNPDASLVVIALVRRCDDAFMVEDCAWRLVDRFGIIYSSRHEFSAGRQLVAAGITFIKPAVTMYRLAGHRHIPDLILFGRDEQRFVVEVDPSAGRRTTQRKRRRNEHYRLAGAKFLCWNCKRNDLASQLAVQGFET